MKPNASTLNPFAQAYVPLAIREISNKEEEDRTFPASDEHPAIDDQKLKGQQIDAPRDLRSDNPQEMDAKLMDEESEIDLAYLQTMFPGVSDQSLLDVYNVNRGDLEASVDMLIELESADDFPDSSAAEVQEKPAPLAECSSVKALKVTGDPSCASGSSSNLVVPT